MNIIKFTPAEDQSNAKPGETIYDFECDDDSWKLITDAAEIFNMTPEEYIKFAIIEAVKDVVTKKEKEDDA